MSNKERILGLESELSSWKKRAKLLEEENEKLKVSADGNLPFENDPFYWKRLYEIAEATNKRLELTVKEKEMENKMLRDEIERLHATIRAFSTPSLPTPTEPVSPTVSPWNKKPGIPDYARYNGPIKLSRS